MKIILFDGVFVVSGLLLFLSWYLFRPLRHHPRPAAFTCLTEADGKFKSLPLKPKHIFGIGLSYAQHIDETAHEFNPDGGPAVFIKHNRSLQPGGGKTEIPGTGDLLEAATGIDPTLRKTLRENFTDFPPLMDYEAELGFILLENIPDEKLHDPSFIPKLGFLLANDLSARSLQVLGEDMPNRLEYWGMSKSLQDFLPTSKEVWIPNRHVADAIPCITLETRVNGEIRQRASTDNMIYTPRQMLIAARATYPRLPLTKGDIVIMGTPGGIALSAPRFKARLAELLRFSRFTKLKFIFKGDLSKFLKAGDEVIASGSWLGEVRTRLK
jgi:2-keto-4-pentenoate hydratase/2-oxohepta-3-ene-1,7-dioic acid hydratase in catechol pathway